MYSRVLSATEIQTLCIAPGVDANGLHGHMDVV